MHSEAREVRRASLIPFGRDPPGWTVIRLLCTHTAYQWRDEVAPRDALRRMHEYAPSFVGSDGSPHFEAALREQRDRDADHDLRAETDMRTKRAIRWPVVASFPSRLRRALFSASRSGTTTALPHPTLRRQPACWRTTGRQSSLPPRLGARAPCAGISSSPPHSRATLPWSR